MAPRTLNKLSARKVETLRKPGRHADGGGLCLHISSTGTKKWTYRFHERGTGRVREMGLGAFPFTTLEEAREKAIEARRLTRRGVDPLRAKQREAAEADSTPDVPTFEQVLDMLIASRSAGWKSFKHKQQWRNSVAQHGASLMPLKIDAITADNVIAVLEPIWSEKAETASRVRSRIENVIDYATSRGLREGANPARWRGHLQHVLPKRKKLARGHFVSMPYREVPAFVADLMRSQSVSARAMEVLIRCALRTSEVTGAEWREIDLKTGIWTIPGARMKAGVAFQIPLPPRVVAIFKELAKAMRGPYVFVGNNRDKPLSNMALESLLRKKGLKPVTTHGFRSSFRTWAAEKTRYPREVAEACLSHVIANSATEKSYLRTDLFDSRRRLLRDWQRFLDSSKRARK